MDSLNNSQNSDTKQTQSPQTESQVRKSDRAPAPRKLLKGTHKAGKHGVQEGELSSSSQTPNPKKKKGRASKSAIGKTAKQPPAKESPTRTRVAGKRTIVAPDIYNPEKLSEKHAEARQLATKGRKVQAKKRASKS